MVYKFCFTCSRFLSAYVYLGMFLFAHVRVCMRACAYMRMCCVCVCMWICVRRYACVYLYICMHAFFFHLVYMKLKILLKSYFWDFHSTGFVVGFNYFFCLKIIRIKREFFIILRYHDRALEFMLKGQDKLFRWKYMLHRENQFVLHIKGALYYATFTDYDMFIDILSSPWISFYFVLFSLSHWCQVMWSVSCS